MRVGLFGARDDNTGLGTQTWEFFRHVKPAKTLVLDFQEINSQNGKITKSYPERFIGAGVERIKGFPDQTDIDRFLKDLDLVFCVEVPYNYDLFSEARKRGIKTVLQYNYEFLDYLNQPNLPKPDLLMAPSPWHYEDVIKWVVDNKFDCPAIYLPVPIAMDRFKDYPVRNIAKTFLHVAGHQTTQDRNGTATVLEAIKHVKSKDVTIGIKTQHELDEITDRRVVVIHEQNGVAPQDEYWNLYNSADVLLLPRRYGGLSLQWQEAAAAGLVPVVGKHDPYAKVSPVRVRSKYGGKIKTRTEIDYYDVDPVELAKAIDNLAGKNIGKVSKSMINYAADMSWEKLLPIYKETFEELCATAS